MSSERRIVTAFARAIKQARQENIYLLDEEGIQLYPSQSEGAHHELPAELFSSAEAVHQNGLCYLPVGSTGFVLCAPEQTCGQHTLALVGVMLELIVKSERTALDKPSMLRALLKGESGAGDIEQLVKAFRIPSQSSYCAIVLKSAKAEALAVKRVVQYVNAKGDLLVDVDAYTVAVLQKIDDQCTFEDACDIALALSTTLETETAYDVVVGVGEPQEGLEGFCKAYQQALMAVEVGKAFRDTDKVHAYRSLLLERFMYTVDASVADRFFRLVFPSGIPKWYNDEMAQTVEKYFENSMNLSETSRQLYIHRNTLVYRLDKIQKATGLDLRVFDDAVTFKILLLMGKIQKPDFSESYGG